MGKLSNKYNFKESEKKWQNYWQDNKVFKFDWNEDKNQTYSIDTPPPSVSGVLHMGHIFGYSQMDIIARYHRMKGKNVFYPVGYDNNGLPSERYVEKKLNIKSKSMDRQEFIDICNREIKEASDKIRNLFITAGYSFDFDLEYSTISDRSRTLSQMSFIDLYNKGFMYRKEEPVIWDVIDQTALAQTEAEDKEMQSQMNYIKFYLADKGLYKNDEIIDTEKIRAETLEIMTTRPELIPACVGIFAHPDDKSKYENKEVITPLGVLVPIYFDESVEKEKGTGVMMCCTFGDNADVEKWKKYCLDLRIILDEKGVLNLNDLPIDEKYKTALNGIFIEKARAKILELLESEGKILKAPVPILHNVKVGERSKYPLEILVKKQWQICCLNIKDQLHEKAREIKWHPAWMEGRIHSWIDGLNWDWGISRQRFFGVPIPCWYSKRKGEEGKVLLPSLDELPIDPSKDLPKGYSEDEVVREMDVFDTWATSAISPELSSWGITDKMYLDKERFEKITMPFDLRAQGHDIIRTWAFCTMVKSFYHQDTRPWDNIFINGFCLSEDGTKMSKSLGNVIDPIKIIDEFGTDAVRYWTSNSQLGTDTSFSRDIIKVGQKLVGKIFNSGKFVEMCLENIKDEVNTAKLDVESGLIYEKFDMWILTKLRKTIEKMNDSFEIYEYGRARESIEDFFWNDFCDNYLEIAKVRCYGANGTKYKDMVLSAEELEKINKGQQSALRTLYYVFNAVLKLFSPFVPHITEEVFSNLYGDEFKKTMFLGARGNWPKYGDLPELADILKIGDESLRVIFEVRKYKSEHNVSIKEMVENIRVFSPLFIELKGVEEDLKNVCNVGNIEFAEGEFGIQI